MSRIGKAPITLPDKVEVKAEGKSIKVKGPLGELLSPLPAGIRLEEVSAGVVHLVRADDSREQKERHGLARAILNNNIVGVSQGWKRNLELVGVGYRVQLKGTSLVFALGFSHEVNFPVPSGVKAAITDQTKIELNGIDRQLVGQVAAEIRDLRPPEPYKGKGLRYAGEAVRRKAGKTGKAGKGK